MTKPNTGVDAPARKGDHELAGYAGEWVVVQDERVIEHGPDLAHIVEKARAKGIRCPRVLFIEPDRPDTVNLGL